MLVTLGIILGIFMLKIQLTRSVIFLFVITAVVLVMTKEETVSYTHLTLPTNREV